MEREVKRHETILITLKKLVTVLHLFLFNSSVHQIQNSHYHIRTLQQISRFLLDETIVFLLCHGHLVCIVAVSTMYPVVIYPRHVSVTVLVWICKRLRHFPNKYKRGVKLIKCQLAKFETSILSHYFRIFNFWTRSQSPENFADHAMCPLILNWAVKGDFCCTLLHNKASYIGYPPPTHSYNSAFGEIRDRHYSYLTCYFCQYKTKMETDQRLAR